MRPKLRWSRARAGYPLLRSRKMLVAHLLLARAQTAHSLAMEDDWVQWESDLRASSETAAKDFNRTKDNNVQLSDHLRDVFATFKDRAPPDSAEAAKARWLFEAESASLEQDLSCIDCQSCAGSATVCNDRTPVDAVNMQGAAQCWHHVDDLADCAVKVAQAAYDSVCAVGSPEVEVEIAVSVLPAGKDGVGGTVTFPANDSKTQRSAWVTLYLPETLGRSEYLRSLYAIFHEIFVHSVQALGFPVQRPVIDELCRFTEGFVDAAAAEVLRNALRLGAATTYGPALRLLFDDGTRRGHQTRTEIPAAPDEQQEKIAKHRREGNIAFQHLQAIFDQDTAISIAMRLNLCLADAGVRDQLADTLTWLTMGWLSPSRKAMIAALRQFAVDGEWPSLAAALGIQRVDSY